MNHKAKTDNREVLHLNAALRMVGYNISHATSHHLLLITKGIEEKRGEFSIDDSIRIEAEVEAMYPDEKEKAEVKEEVSEEV